MWEVIRGVQGIPPNVDQFAEEEPEQQYERNQRCILMHQAQPEVPYIDPKVLTRAYGDFHMEKVRRWLLDEDAHLRMQAVDELIDLYTAKREYRTQSLHYGLLPVLVVMLCTDEEEDLRQRAATALEMLVHEPAAQHLLVPGAELFGQLERDSDLLLHRLLYEATSDKSDAVAALALRVLKACHAYVNNFAATEALVEMGEVGVVLKIVETSENPLVRAVACTALAATFDVKEAHIIFQRAGGMAVVTQAIKNTDDEMLIAEAAEVVSHAAEWPQGKRDAVQHGTIAALAPHITSTNLTTRVSVVAALAQITVWEPAKFQVVEQHQHLMEAICGLVAEEDERDVIAHLAKLIYHIAEHPQGRTALRGCKPRLMELLGFADSEDLSVQLSLQNAIEILSRKS